MIFQRLLKTRDTEFYRVIQNGNIEDVFGYLLIHDKREPAEINDFKVFAKSNINKEAFSVNIKKKSYLHDVFSLYRFRRRTGNSKIY